MEFVSENDICQSRTASIHSYGLRKELNEQSPPDEMSHYFFLDVNFFVGLHS